MNVNDGKIKNIVKIDVIVIIQEEIGAMHSICNLKYSLPKKNPIVFHNGSNYDYHFLIKDLAEEFKKHLLL